MVGTFMRHQNTKSINRSSTSFFTCTLILFVDFVSLRELPPITTSLSEKLFLRSKTWYGSSSSALLSSPLSDRMLSVWCLRLMGRSLLKYILFCMGPSFFLKYHAVSERRHTEANVTSRATERQ